MDRFKLTKQDRINQYKIIMYNVKNDLEYYTRPDTVRRLDEMGFFDAPASINHHGAYSGALFDHSLAVTGALLDYTDKMGLTWSDARSPYIVGKVLDAADNIKQKLRSLRKRGRAYREYKRLYNDFCTYRTDLEHWREMHERWAKGDE